MTAGLRLLRDGPLPTQARPPFGPLIFSPGEIAQRDRKPELLTAKVRTFLLFRERKRSRARLIGGSTSSKWRRVSPTRLFRGPYLELLHAQRPSAPLQAEWP